MTTVFVMIYITCLADMAKAHTRLTLPLLSVCHIHFQQSFLLMPAILFALKFVASSDKSKFMICSDSLSCMLLIESCKTQNPFILKIGEIYKSLVAVGKHVVFTWIPSHIGIHGNTVVDQEAKDALDDPIFNCSIPFTDFKPFNMKYILKCWQDSWDQQIYNKLHEIHSLVGKAP